MDRVFVFERVFSNGELEIICKLLGDTYSGLTGTEIGHFLVVSKIEDVNPDITKWKRLFNALVNMQNNTQTGKCVLNFIKHVLEPSRYVGRNGEFIDTIDQINKIMVFRGLEYQDDGKYHKVKEMVRLSEIQLKTKRLKEKLISRNVHPFILDYCKAELLQENYFHAVLEACKSISSKIRSVTGLSSDGAVLIDEAFGGSNPPLKINSFNTDSKISEQKGFVNLAKGLFGTFRNPTAHSAKIEWEMTEEDALDLFVLASYVIRRIDRINK